MNTQPNNRTDFGQIGREMAREQERIERRKSKPDNSGPFLTSVVLWAVLAFAGFYADSTQLLGWLVVGVILVAFIAGIVWRPLRSGASPAIVYVVPLWGIVARLDRVATCRALRTAKIYTDADKTKTIPATTWHANGDTFVYFDGGGLAGMNPDHLRDLLTQNARVWRCRSFAVSEDRENPGRITVQLSSHETVRTTLDRAITGVIA